MNKLRRNTWCYRFPARKTAALQRRAEQAPDEVQAIAWKAQKRLCGRYQAGVEQAWTTATENLRSSRPGADGVYLGDCL